MSFSDAFDDKNASKKIQIISNVNNGNDDDQQVQVVLRVRFLDPLPPLEREFVNSMSDDEKVLPLDVFGGFKMNSCKQFWKAGDNEASDVLGIQVYNLLLLLNVVSFYLWGLIIFCYDFLLIKFVVCC